MMQHNKNSKCTAVLSLWRAAAALLLTIPAAAQPMAPNPIHLANGKTLSASISPPASP